MNKKLIQKINALNNVNIVMMINVHVIKEETNFIDLNQIWKTKMILNMKGKMRS